MIHAEPRKRARHRHVFANLPTIRTRVLTAAGDLTQQSDTLRKQIDEFVSAIRAA